MNAGEPLTLRGLIERVWGGDPPSSASATVYAHIAQLRALLADASPAIHKRGSDGYVLEARHEQVDVLDFRTLVRRARSESDTGVAVKLWREADALVRGEALPGIDGGWAAQLRSAAHNEHSTMLVELFTSELARGRHVETAAELPEYLARYPLAEGLVECLMTGLFRCGRQVEALDCYGPARSRLAEELGIDPGRRLRHRGRSPGGMPKPSGCAARPPLRTVLKASPSKPPHCAVNSTASSIRREGPPATRPGPAA